MLIDSHAHVHFDDYQEEVPEILARAADAGVGCLINVGTDLVTSQKAIDSVGAHGRAPLHLFATIGIHPHETEKATEDDLNQLRTMANNETVVAVGEIGLDYHYMHSPKELQQEWLRKQIQLAHEVKLPIIIHCRDAFDDCFNILSEEEAWKLGGVYHCFTGDKEIARKVVKKGWYISFSGIVTFKNAHDIQEAAQNIPRDRFLIETDAPYLAPTPLRGKRNEPAYLRHTAEFLAKIKKVAVEDIERISARNTKELFGLPIDLPDDRPKIAYKIRNSLYLNITNQCTLACTFCPKFDDWMVKGHFLELKEEPSFEEVLDAAGDPTAYQEIVFCGFGESTLRLDLLKDLAQKLKKSGAKKIRLDTEGLGNLVHGKNILPELSNYIDTVSVSLNAPDAKTYAKICPSRFGEQAYSAVKEFIIEAKKHIPEVIASVVGLPNLDVGACRHVAEEELGVEFRLRPYDEVG